ncbi:nuclear transport factor 2 family protein [Bdellovibrio reynosensis]|uniref:Nuclear transport factor 2 family protein n=1 Tax=Bdellovibrio reynosensis TaxID=2835041 RepID=A0ABY4C6R6_9BACT|nr:nuclear transport factor 2 family protein [Bdellovibrio reynosensis]UOF00642.1 nuclear transport factor 2 family protein [Bdellovibrio reynosensis]
MTKKEIAISFLKEAASGDVKSAYDKFVAPGFIHHNQYFKGDRQSLLQAMEEANKVSPNKSIEVKYSYEDGNTVICHSLVKRKDPEAAGIAVVHIMRFENSKITELWDLGQEILKDCPNENGLF